MTQGLQESLITGRSSIRSLSEKYDLESARLEKSVFLYELLYFLRRNFSWKKEFKAHRAFAVR